MKKLLAVLLLLVVYPAYSQDYTVAPITPPPLQNINTQGGTNLNLADDGMAYDVKLGFDFTFYGNTFNNVNISNNGFLTFGGLNSMCCDGQQLPAWGMDNSIIGLWTDLISINNTNPYYKSYALNGDRIFTVGWYGTLEFYNIDAPNNFEITLYKDSNNILFNYGDVNVYTHSFTVGLQGTDGQFEQIINGRNANQLDNTAYLFTYIPPEPPPPPEPPIAPDCSINPAYINCIIQTVPTDNTVMVSNNNNNQTTVEEPITNQVIGGTVDLESLLSINGKEEETKDKEEKEEELKDDIQTSILQQALANTETNRNKNKDGDINSQTVNVNTTNGQTNDDENNTVSTNSIIETVTDEIMTTDVPTTDDSIQLVAQLSVLTEISLSQNNGDVIEEQSTEVVNESYTLSAEITESVIASANSQLETELDELSNMLKNITQQKTFQEEETDEFLANTISINGMPAIVNVIQPFNNDSNMMDKVAAGVFGKIVDKSDAEKAADKIVAANKEQQDEISKNYMDADQSGLIGAMTDGTDVTAYRTAMIPDLSKFYKPEDIYKNVSYKDNVRNMYFLEKGNTDTYKKMVEEQYK